MIENFDLGEQGNKGRFFRGTGILAPLRASEMLQLFVIMTFSSLHNNNKKFRSFKSKENIHKKEVGPYHDFGY